MPGRNLIIGTAGHIDHGKTVLVKAMTGRDTDRLDEEKKRGISIDLGFAPLAFSDGSTAGIVDVPGHENFIRNMLAGATGVDLALLVVAADDSVMPQTREHLAILTLLGVSGAVVAVTKADLVDPDMLPLVEEDIRSLLDGTTFSGSPIVPVSAITGEGIDELKSELEKSASRIDLKDLELPSRLPVDRVFTLKGIGTVVTGTLWSGVISAGDRLVILPGDREVRVRSVQVHETPRESAQAGERVALNLAGVSRSEVSRGDVLSAPGYLKPTYMIDARISVLGECKKPLKRSMRVRFHHGTRELLGRIYPLEGDSVAPGENRPAQLRLEGEAVCAPGDRFVLRSYSPVTTIGGGVIVDTHPAKHRLRDPEALEEFERLEKAAPEETAAIFLSRSNRPLAVEEIAIESGLPVELAGSALEKLADSGLAVKFGHRGSPAYLGPAQYEKTAESLRSALEEFHRKKPLLDGMARETLKKQVLRSWDDRLADIMIEHQTRRKELDSDGRTVSLPGRSASVTAEQREKAEKVVEVIKSRPVSPPTVSEMAKELELDRETLVELLRIEEKKRTVIRISPDLYFYSESVGEIENRLKSSVSGRGITVSEFRSMIDTSRKYALPLLEYFDRIKVTTRVGDVRKLR